MARKSKLIKPINAEFTDVAKVMITTKPEKKMEWIVVNLDKDEENEEEVKKVD